MSFEAPFYKIRYGDYPTRERAEIEKKKILNFSFFIFNFADAFITVGAILLIYFELIYKSNNE